MVSRRILAHHVMKATGLAMLGAVLLLTLLQMLFGYLAELGELNDHYNAWQALQYIFWDAPHKMLDLLPISALMGAVLGLGTLASNSELVVMRSVGVSLWRIVGWVIRPALLLIVLSFVLSQWVIPYTNEQAKAVQKQGYAATLGEVRGYWTREGQRFIYIDYANSKGQLNDIQVLDFDQNYRLVSMINAAHGQFEQAKQWQLSNASQIDIFTDGRAQKIDSAIQGLPLALQPRYVHMVTVDPEDLAPSQLLSFMGYLHEYSQIPKKYELAFWKKVASPFSLIALVIVACSFIFGPLRQQSMGFRLVIALFTGLGFYYLQDFLGYASLVYSPSAAWFVLVPIVILMGIGAYLLHRMR
ncbi:LPS export ABC transporter permease LptG [Acinetobacter qingfengensis]|uniref:LPS export ABC transporter permease LptG n=1 Tax=Acinetobacter qingfengensis TaxID=1262585 RepID=A0A1E7QYY3_9GAMM|nr:LPS export ABC transporter permease LptG [Acinetobacter qingfengensis]KAA8733158.1 LPS export ABC transporter permease LptG [Acinetobacter qingfengensis]OEY92308.1 LPS export ABC transporter permease LptG [Acinetobacter qingfengensis]